MRFTFKLPDFSRPAEPRDVAITSKLSNGEAEGCQSGMPCCAPSGTQSGIFQILGKGFPSLAFGNNTQQSPTTYPCYGSIEVHIAIGAVVVAIVIGFLTTRDYSAVKHRLSGWTTACKDFWTAKVIKVSPMSPCHVIPT